MVFDDVLARGADVRKAALLRFLQIRQDRAGREDRGIVFVETDPSSGTEVPLPFDFFLCVMGGELPTGARRDRVDPQRLDLPADVVGLTGRELGDQYLGGTDSGDLVQDLA